ncbi:MAG: SDR family NAD(P)-dependent oxidoreductase [Sneathiellaceae bacterium]
MAGTEKLVLVTGAAGALGRAVCAEFAGRGRRVVAIDRDAGGLRAAFGEGGMLQVAVDLLDARATAGAVEALVASHGPVDTLACIAGGFAMGPAVHEEDPADYRRLMDMNFATTQHIVRAALPGMLAERAGCVLTIGALAALSGKAQMGAYCVSKSAVMRLTETLAAELRGTGVRANCILPSIIDTPVNRAAMPDADPGQWVRPEQLAQIMAFLAGPEGAAIHGALLPVDGGH